MPYIPKQRRIELQYQPPLTAGELNYEITRLLNLYWQQSQAVAYQTINDIVGALESAKLEFYRRVAAPYEDKKKEENGEVYSVLQE